jgi:hypothetical protein
MSWVTRQIRRGLAGFLRWRAATLGEHAQGQIHHGEDAANDEEEVAGQARPFQESHEGLLEEFGRPGVPVAVLEAVGELQEAYRH